MPLGIRPTVDVTIKNPFNYHDFLDDKPLILDVKAVDIQNNRILENSLEIHVLESPRYHLKEIDLASALRSRVG